MFKHNLHLNSDENARIFMLSQRHQTQRLADCCLFEFEDIIRDVDTVDMFAPVNSYDRSLEVYKWVKRLTRSTHFANWVRPEPNPYVLDREYDLFYALLRHPLDIFSLFSIQNWRQNCQKKVCYLIEIWDNQIESHRPFIELLKDFDHIFLGVANSTERISQITGRPCTYLPPSVDAVKFCPYPFSPDRSIDVTNIGRRSTLTHEALLELVERGKINYLYDTVGNKVLNSQQHRILLANQLKRSQYFIANRPMANKPEIRGRQAEIGYRFFEGAAAGSVMLGDYPDTEMFHQYFDWEDAVIRIPFDAGNIADILAELDAQPDRLEKIRRDNVINSLLRHDWVHRWKTIIETAGLSSTPQMLSREAHLQELAKMAYREWTSLNELSVLA